MAKAMPVEEAQGDEPEAETESAASGLSRFSDLFGRLKTAFLGLLTRARSVVSTQIGLAFDAVILALQRQRGKFVPPASPEAAQALAAALAVEKPAGRGILRKLLIGLLLAMAGAVAGSVFAFSVFAQKIERQGELITNQADEVFEYRNDAERAETARDKARDELKAVRHELAELGQSYEQTKTRLAEAEGRMLMYGGARALAEPPAPRLPARSGGGARAGTQSNASNARSGECELKSGSAGSDLSRCLSMSR